MTPNKPQILFSKAKIQARVDELAKVISKDYEGRLPYLVVVLKGAVIFASDLMRSMTIPVELDFIGISSYGGGTRSTGVVRITKDLDASVESKHVLVVEDIVDSGQTLNYLLKSFQQRRPASLKVASFLVRPDRREVDVAIDYKGFDIPDTFVLGYGMDYRERYRGLPYIFKVDHLPSGDDILFKTRDEEQGKK
ncbi:MAG: hypoxanthine phosphoribosyltransferase [bacterium]|nr:hypoxanthine phosphoribosyltransferase [bacterium]